MKDERRYSKCPYSSVSCIQSSNRKIEERGNPSIQLSLLLWDGSMCMSKTKVIRRDGPKTESFSPKTSRGRRLLALRNKIIAADIPLLSPEEIEEEVRVRRGEDE